MRPFEYVSPATVDEAVGVLREHGAEAKVLAGGQSLLPLLNYRLARPRVVVDINDLPLSRIDQHDGRLRLGALVRHHALIESPVVARACPLLAEAASLVGNVRVRSLGTVGGSHAHADPAAELAMAMVALGARLTVHGPSGTRTLDSDRFFTGYLTTALAADELLADIDVPVTNGSGWAVEEFSRRAGDFAIVAVAALVAIDARGHVADVRIALGGVGPSPWRAARAEEALGGHEPTSDRLERAATAARESADPASDAFVSAAYRRHLAGVLTRRALARAVTRAMEVR